MKKILASLVLALGLVAFAAGSAMAKEIIVMNGCDFPIPFLGITSAEATKAENLLSEPMKPGEGVKVNITINKVDITVQDGQGGQVDFQGLDFTSKSKITLKSDGTATME